MSDRLYITGMNEDETREIFSAYTLTGKKVYEVAYSPDLGRLVSGDPDNTDDRREESFYD